MASGPAPDNLDDAWELTVIHLRLSLVPIVLGLLIAVPLGAAVQRSNLQPRDPSRGACSPSRAFWEAPRAIVGLKRGGGGWCILASAMTERVVASSHANSRLASKPSTRGGVGRGTLFQTLTC